MNGLDPETQQMASAFMLAYMAFKVFLVVYIGVRSRSEAVAAIICCVAFFFLAFVDMIWDGHFGRGTPGIGFFLVIPLYALFAAFVCGVKDLFLRVCRRIQGKADPDSEPAPAADAASPGAPSSPPSTQRS